MTNKSLQGYAALQEWRKQYNPKKADKLTQETRQSLRKVISQKDCQKNTATEQAFSM